MSFLPDIHSVHCDSGFFESLDQIRIKGKRPVLLKTQWKEHGIAFIDHKLVAFPIEC